MQLAGGNETVLLVEDEVSVQTVIGRLLRKLGYTVLIAGDGFEGVSIYEEQGEEIDLVITDIVMPGMNGIEMAKELRERSPELKVLFISGYVGSETGQLKDPPPQPFLPKPFSVEELSETVREILDS